MKGVRRDAEGLDLVESLQLVIAVADLGWVIHFLHTAIMTP